MTHSLDHTFALCAYGESPHLKDCINSLMTQMNPSKIVICTATPNKHIDSLAKEYDLELKIRNGSPNICDDWNFALSQCDSALATLAHQDDIYDPTFAETVIDHASKAQRPLICFTDYYEIRGDEKVLDTKLLNIKRKMLIKLIQDENWGNKKIRRRALSMGSPICCPSVTFNLDVLERPIFNKGFSGNLDWDAWERISKKDGDFVYCPQPLMGHRIHEGSETSKLIRDNVRTKEDLAMFKRFWPAPIAHIINTAYSSAQKSN